MDKIGYREAYIFIFKFVKIAKTAIIAVIYFNMKVMLVKTMTALEAKNSFGKFLTASQREPVTVTKNSQEIGAMFSMEDLQNMAHAYLPVIELQRVQDGKIGLVEALMYQVNINNKISKSRQEFVEGKTLKMDAAYFDNLKSRISQTS